MENVNQKEERYQKMHESMFAKFKQASNPVVGKPGFVTRTVDGEEYQMKLWGVRRALQEWDNLWLRYGTAIVTGIEGFIRYNQKRKSVEGGPDLVHLEDVERGEALITYATKLLIDAAKEDGDGISSFIFRYFPGMLTRKLKTPNGKEVWVDVLDTTDKEDWREVEGIPVGFDAFYIQKKSSLMSLLYWIFAENLGGFFFDKLPGTIQKVLQEETKQSSPVSKQEN